MSNAGNPFMNSGDVKSAGWNQLSLEAKKNVKALNEMIKTKRNAEKIAIEQLNAFVAAGKAMPVTTMLDGTQTTDPTLIHGDINDRTRSEVRKLETAIDNEYKKCGVDVKTIVEKKVVSGGTMLGRWIGKTFHSPVQAVKQGIAQVKKETAPVISTQEQDMLSL